MKKKDKRPAYTVKLLCGLIVLSMFSSSTVYADDFAKYSVESIFLDVLDGEFSKDHPFELGFGFRPVKKTNINFLTGFDGNSGSAGSTDDPPVPFSYTLHGKLGLTFDIHQNDNSKLAVVFQAGGILEKRIIEDGNSDGWTSYNYFSPVGFLGLEPSIHLSKNFVLFARYGIEIVSNPNSKSFEYAGMNSSTGQSFYVLASDNDAQKVFSSNSLGIGIRYEMYPEKKTVPMVAEKQIVPRVSAKQTVPRIAEKKTVPVVVEKKPAPVVAETNVIPEVEEKKKITPEELFDKAAASLKKSNYREAVTYSDTAIEMYPEAPMAYRARGYAYLKLNKKAEACRDLKTYLKLNKSIDENDARKVQEWLVKAGGADGR